MSQVVLILGKSGSGKTSSIFGLDEDEVNVISATGKPMPFKSDIPVFKPKNLSHVQSVCDRTKAPIVVIDDANYFLTFYKAEHLMDSNPYLAPKQVAKWFTDLMNHLMTKEGDQIFYILAHTEIDEDNARVFKTTGKFIREDLGPEGLTNIVVESFREDGDYKFAVKPLDDVSPVKTPRGMFDTDVMPNDLKELDKTIRDFYKPIKKEK